MSEPPEGPPGTPFLGRHRAVPRSGYRPVVGAHRAHGLGGPSRGYLFTVALLAGTASMPILAAISTGAATVGNSALPDTSTPFIPTPSVGPVVIPLPLGTQLPLRPTPTPVAGPGATTVPPAPVLPAAPALPDDSDLGTRHRSRPAAPPPTPGPTRTRPAGPPRPSPVPSPSPSPSPSDPATPEPSPSPTAEPTGTWSEPTPEPSPTGEPDPTTSPPDGTPSPTCTPPDEWPMPTLSPRDDPDPSATASGTTA
ncbi:hypothetical protein ABZV78_00030 [Micromonospora sp. NPDC004540]|uniref:hypothetical protein n=1 Tax=Micromonospora sp. NPDC004540 TaxID=3154457 RepID=UPI00339E6951